MARLPERAQAWVLVCWVLSLAHLVRQRKVQSLLELDLHVMWTAVPRSLPEGHLKPDQGVAAALHEVLIRGAQAIALNNQVQWPQVVEPVGT
jgi:hypothetical protein